MRPAAARRAPDRNSVRRIGTGFNRPGKEVIVLQAVRSRRCMSFARQLVVGLESAAASSLLMAFGVATTCCSGPRCDGVLTGEPQVRPFIGKSEMSDRLRPAQ